MAMVLSNCMNINGSRIDPVLPQLKLFVNKPKKSDVRVLGDDKAITTSMVERLRHLISNHTPPREVQLAMAEVNAEASKHSVGKTISPECVTGHLLPTGAAEVTPHGIDEKAGYMPGFVARSLIASGVSGFAAKLDENGKALSPRWGGLTARAQGGRRKNAATVVLHAISNVGEPISEGTKPNVHVYWKIAGKDEPEQYTFHFGKS